MPTPPTTIAILGSGTAARQLHAPDWLQQADITYWGNYDAAGFSFLKAEEQRTFRFLFNQSRLRIEQERVLFVYVNAEN
ncbi:Wadjet anti-phage system protein JetD domain-containing protein [Corynebacterium aurimucosum]|uniref:Wadjet anti-phage system protein JetD domain-containing protein n=1 Tax=Corynebacterium aurimucosum TaxID=169292 RepID=UPI00209EE90B|nr:Wadjet anti-phage system protein JetD domain-containing protein [Corynebacterium aurimucosum]